MQVSLNPKTTALWVYIVLSLAFIAYVLVTGFRDGMLRNAYQAGSADTIKTLLDRATNGKCEAVNVFSNDKKADLVDVACLKKPEGAAPEATAPAPAAK